MTERTCEHSYRPYEGCPYCKEYRRGLEVGQSTIDRLAAIQPDPEPVAVAWRVFDGLSGLSPMKEALYPASRKAHALEFAKITRGQCQPLYATPSSAGTVSVEAAAVAEAATEYLRWIECDFPSGIRPAEMEAREKLRTALRAIAGEGGR